MIRSFGSPISLAAAFACIATLLIVLAPGVKFGYWSPSLHATIETTAAIVSALVAYLVAGRYRRNARLGDLLRMKRGPPTASPAGCCCS
jgi:hypothetical protein